MSRALEVLSPVKVEAMETGLRLALMPVEENWKLVSASPVKVTSPAPCGAKAMLPELGLTVKASVPFCWTAKRPPEAEQVVHWRFRTILGSVATSGEVMV